MADVLKIKDVNGNEIADLLNGDLRLVYPTAWNTRTPGMVGTYTHVPYGAQPRFEHFAPVAETMTLFGHGTGSDLRAAKRLIELTLVGAQRYHEDPLEDTSYWLHCAMDGEDERRALIYEGSMGDISAAGFSHFAEDGKIKCVLYMTRHPFWESATATPTETAILDCLGGTEQLSYVLGTSQTIPNRLSIMEIENNDASVLTDVWCGLKPHYAASSIPYFNPVWECEDGTNATGASDQAAVGTASGDAYVQVLFSGDATLVERMAITIDDVIADPSHADDFRGRYLVLARCKVTADATIGVQMKSGYKNSDSLAPANEVYLEHSSWELRELGEIQIPPQAMGSDLNWTYLRGFEIELWAEHVSGTVGSDTLDLDCLVLIPSDHFFKIEDGYCTAGSIIRLNCRENDTYLAVAEKSGYPDISTQTSIRDWYVPSHEASTVVLAAQRSSSHNLGDKVRLKLEVYQRYMSYRG